MSKLELLTDAPDDSTLNDPSFDTQRQRSLSDGLNKVKTLDQVETFTKTLENQMEKKTPTVEDTAKIEESFNDESVDPSSTKIISILFSLK